MLEALLRIVAACVLETFVKALLLIIMLLLRHVLLLLLEVSSGGVDVEGRTDDDGSGGVDKENGGIGGRLKLFPLWTLLLLLRLLLLFAESAKLPDPPIAG